MKLTGYLEICNNFGKDKIEIDLFAKNRLIFRLYGNERQGKTLVELLFRKVKSVLLPRFVSMTERKTTSLKAMFALIG